MGRNTKPLDEAPKTEPPHHDFSIFLFWLRFGRLVSVILAMYETHMKGALSNRFLPIRKQDYDNL